MGILTDDMKRIIAEQGLGFVATVDADGGPNLSPKGTMLVLDDMTIGFSDIRSPGTRRNIAHDPRMEINFVDPFARRGFRFRGAAHYAERGSDGFAALFPRFEAAWPSLAERMRGIVTLVVERALPVTTPPYDTGVSEQQLRQAWTDRYRAMQPGGDFLPPATASGDGWKP